MSAVICTYSTSRIHHFLNFILKNANLRLLFYSICCKLFLNEQTHRFLNCALYFLIRLYAFWQNFLLPWHMICHEASVQNQDL
jgi:hypothetical protein